MKRFIGVYDYTVILTYLSLCSAVLGLVFASDGSLSAAVLCLLFSGILDAFDGAVARTKKNRTEDEKNFGIQLDSLCDVIAFGVLPAFICYRLGVRDAMGVIFILFYTLCALIRLAFFNVIEAKRQKAEAGKRKYYRGLPVTSVCVVLPFLYLLGNFLSGELFVFLLYLMLAAMGFLFVLDFKVKKPNFDKLVSPKRSKMSEEDNTALKDTTGR